MAFKLEKGVYLVRCRHPGCPFHADIKIELNLMGTTAEDVEEEAVRVARDKGNTMHDAVYGTSHQLENPEVHKSSGRIRPLRPS
jgi:hypothetical protein